MREEEISFNYSTSFSSGEIDKKIEQIDENRLKSAKTLITKDSTRKKVFSENKNRKKYHSKL